MKLFCFPYAGATSVTFLRWRKYFDEIKIIPIDPPGRGSRIMEPLCKEIGEMVRDVEKQLFKLVDKGEKYALFGHSMGSLLIYELLHELLEIGFPMPEHVFLSGKNPPHIVAEKPIHQLSEAEFIEKVIAMGGTEAHFFENPLLAKMFLPILRADLGISENYCFKKKNRKLPVDISFFFASDDSMVDNLYVKQWSDYITGFFHMYYFTGGHFFIFEQEEKITEIINDTLSYVHEIIPY